ncbi:MAG: hypothetical protein AAFR96_09375 [Planctomycetota bacterium]
MSTAWLTDDEAGVWRFNESTGEYYAADESGCTPPCCGCAGYVRGVACDDSVSPWPRVYLPCCEQCFGESPYGEVVSVVIGQDRYCFTIDASCDYWLAADGPTPDGSTVIPAGDEQYVITGGSGCRVLDSCSETVCVPACCGFDAFFEPRTCDGELVNPAEEDGTQFGRRRRIDYSFSSDIIAGNLQHDIAHEFNNVCECGLVGYQINALGTRRRLSGSGSVTVETCPDTIEVPATFEQWDDLDLLDRLWIRFNQNDGCFVEEERIEDNSSPPTSSSRTETLRVGGPYAAIPTINQLDFIRADGSQAYPHFFFDSVCSESAYGSESPQVSVGYNSPLGGRGRASHVQGSGPFGTFPLVEYRDGTTVFWRINASYSKLSLSLEVTALVSSGFRQERFLDCDPGPSTDWRLNNVFTNGSTLIFRDRLSITHTILDQCTQGLPLATGGPGWNEARSGGQAGQSGGASSQSMSGGQSMSGSPGMSAVQMMNALRGSG